MRLPHTISSTHLTRNLLSFSLQIDVCDPASVTAAAAAVSAACGGSPPPLYGLINNAGVAPPTGPADIFATNLFGVKVRLNLPYDQNPDPDPDPDPDPQSRLRMQSSWK